MRIILINKIVSRETSCDKECN